MISGPLDFSISIPRMPQPQVLLAQIEAQKTYLIQGPNYIFIGLCFDAHQAQLSSQELLQQIDFEKPFKELLNDISAWSGHFCLIFENNNSLFALNDAGAQQEVYYAFDEQNVYFSSQPQAILDKLKPEWQILNPDLPESWFIHKQNLFQHTIYKHINKLIPNFILNVDKCDLRRFSPTFSAISHLENTAKKACHILENSILAMSYRAPLAIALTAGWDSRLLLAAARNVDNKQIYILNHATDYTQVDKMIAQQICQKLNLELNIIDYQEDNGLNPLPNIWKNNPRNQNLAQVTAQYFPQHFVLNGNVSEVVRGFYDPLPHNLSAKDLLYILNIESNDYVIALMNDWMKSCENIIKKSMFSLLDLLYWEHKMPNWAGEAKSIANQYNICLSPFNNRHLLCLLASVPRKNRQKLNNHLYAQMLELMTPELNKIAINPTKKENKIRFLQKIKLYKPYRWILFRARKLRF